MQNQVPRNIWIDNLRSFLTVLVVAHHASLAYTTFAYFDTSAYISSTSPVVDNARWVGMDIFENFNDIFFMSLMFLLSGLFVFPAITKKGKALFLKDRAKRLGLPFLIAVTLIIPIAYIPSYILVHHEIGAILFIKDYLIVEQWPVGPPWFIWLLFVFNAIAACLPQSFYLRCSGFIASAAKRPAIFIGATFLIVAFAFIPISLWVGQYKWTGIGPFDFQLNRVILYFVFFLSGVCMGSGNWQNYLFRNNKVFGISKIYWIIACLLAYGAVEIFTYTAFDLVRNGKLNMLMGYLIFDCLFIASCLASSLAFVSIFKEKMDKTNPVLTSLSSNAFGIYLIHYVFITWLQFALLNVMLPVGIKFFIVFSGALLVSWFIISWLKKIKYISTVI